MMNIEELIMKNPLLEDKYFIPDVEAHVWSDGRIYLYGSYDIRGAKNYCSEEYHVFSSADMREWTDHGVSFTFPDAKWAADCPYRALYAPDCAERNGNYYLYYCVPDGRCGVAVSKSPCGPFKDIGQIKGMQGIDPAVFIDDDGQAYIYWGQFDGVRSAKLNDDMVTIDESSVTQPLSVKEHDFHEGSSVKKINGKYVFVYTDTHRHKDVKHGGMATCLGYAVSDSPQTGFEYRGVIIDNYGCDPGTWNNHGSICNFKNQWYVFYHRSTHGCEFSRHVCAEKIDVTDECFIKEVEMTSGDLVGNKYVPANLACALTGNVRIGGEKPGLVCAEKGDTATFRFVTLDDCGRISLDGKGAGVNVYLDGTLLCRVPACGEAVFDRKTGKYTLKFEFTGPAELYGFVFK